MGLFSLLIKDPVAFFLLAFPLLYSVIMHELAHGIAASWFGDNTAKDAGRLSLNPTAHLDPMGTLMLFFVGFGWAKPVPVDYRAFKGSKAAIISVSLAGCLTNIIIATIALFLLQLKSVSANSLLATVLFIVAQINIILGSFNLIPIPPLDGSRVLMAFVSEKGRMALARIEPYGFFIIIILLFTGLMHPLITFMRNLIYGFIALLLKLT
jgi:Zn-dependent protease